MPNASIPLYNFYFRYLWNQNDFASWQNGMVSLGRGMFEGLLGASVLKGYEVTTNNLSLIAASGIASGPTGYLHVNTAAATSTVTAPSVNPRLDLLVARPSIVQANYVTDPSNPYGSVPLQQLQQSAVTVIYGTEAATPVYPATQPNDVVLVGARIGVGQTAYAAEDLDFSVRDLPGKNSNFQQDAGKYDDRLRPYLAANPLVGIKPSQLELPFTRVFSYVNKTLPSIFPKTAGGLYNGAAGDTFVNMKTGAITGADGASAALTPVIPTAGNAINAVISVNSTDTLAISYGTQGTRAQCLAGIKNQTASGAGSVSVTASTKPLCFVTAYSADGVNITELKLYDCRGVSAVGSAGLGISAGGTNRPLAAAYPLTLTIGNDAQILFVDTTAARTINLPNPTTVPGWKCTFMDDSGSAGTFGITLHRFAAEKIQGLTADYVMNADYGRWTLYCDGVNYTFID